MIVREAAVKGLGIAMLRRDLVDEHLRNGTLKLVMPDYPPPSKKFFAIFARNKHQPQRVKIFIEFLVKQLKRRQAA